MNYEALNGEFEKFDIERRIESEIDENRCNR